LENKNKNTMFYLLANGIGKLGIFRRTIGFPLKNFEKNAATAQYW
jgi:hypothetical protein